MSRTPRWILAVVLVVFAAMTLSGWATDTPSVRLATAIFAALMLLGAAGAIAPHRFRWALHVIAGAVSLGYIWYFIDEVMRLVRGEAQPIRMGQPSAVMACVGLIVFAIPLGIFAVSGVLVGPFGWRVRVGPRPNAGGEDPPAAI